MEILELQPFATVELGLQFLLHLVDGVDNGVRSFLVVTQLPHPSSLLLFLHVLRFHAAAACVRTLLEFQAGLVFHIPVS